MSKYTKCYIEEIDLSDVPSFEQELTKVEQFKIQSRKDLEDWLRLYSELNDQIRECLDGHYIDFSCQSDNPQAKEAIAWDQEKIEPLIKRYEAKCDAKFLSSPYRRELDQDYYSQYLKSKETAQALFREQNIDLEVEEDRLATKYFELTGSLTADWDGEELTISQLRNHLKNPSESTRKKAMTLMMKSIMTVSDDLQSIMDDLVRLRHKKGENAGFSNFRDFTFHKYERFDYTPEDCSTLGRSVQKHVRPLKDACYEELRKDLGKDTLKIWDIEAVPEGIEPLKPYDTRDELVKKTGQILGNLDPRFSKLLEKMDKQGMLDLESRKGKAPGGFCCPLPVSGLSFIFMNEAGSQDDVVTLLHEMGHCIHNDLKRDLPLSLYRDTPSESSELASMTMELFTMDQWDVFYPDEKDLKRAKKEQFTRILDLLTFCLAVDQFQHWMYENPDHTAEERNDKFEQLSKELALGSIDWSGQEEWHRHRWLFILHIFEVPFYFIEYAIAQLGALQLYQQFKKDRNEALSNYKKALKLGRSVSLPQVYEAAGIRFDFSEATVRELALLVKQELDSL
ncbi:oligoendopeptidase F [Alteribacter lacisalsi]|uniref:Oligoendopeptidase F n=1 Tax=Alteribacter lacisalsi TaxID=2045244 RepID=A0A2W0H8W9_9BACI|nr:M3 family oligoendopeptidase [Alteribacter lacisalsi]PYZ98294.1 oligoendopeptidase F [Alteribacter lacisalsi]